MFLVDFAKLQRPVPGDPDEIRVVFHADDGARPFHGREVFSTRLNDGSPEAMTSSPRTQYGFHCPSGIRAELPGIILSWQKAADIPKNKPGRQ